MAAYDPKSVVVESKDETLFSEHVAAEDIHDGVTSGALLVPESLRGMSKQEMDHMAKRMVWKLDILIMPIMVILYILNYIDRQNIAAARLAGIEQDLGLTDTQYQTCISLLFVGYISFQVPSNMVLSTLSYPAVYICVCTAAWGIVSGATAAVNNFVGLLICRLILGCVEAVFYPAALYYLSCWYTKKQYALRVAILYSGSQLGSAFGNLLAIGILKLDGQHGIAGWRWLFLVEGILTVGLALIFACILPNQPSSTHWLTPQQRDYVVWSLESEQAQKDETDQTTQWQAFVMAIRDPKMWFAIAILFFDFIGAAVSNFFPSVVATLGYSRNITYCLTAPPYILCCIVIILNGLHSDKVQERFLHVFCPLVITILANVIAVATTKTAPRYVAMMLMPASYYAASTVTVSWIAGATNGPRIKRAIVLATINAVVNTPNIWTSYLYRNAPRYLLAFCVNLGSSVIALGACCSFLIYLRKSNSRMERGLDTGKSGPTPEQVANGYRYPL